MRGIDDIKRRKEIIDGKGVLTVPFPVASFRGIYPGLEREQIIITSSYSKGSKTQFSSWAFLYNTIEFCIRNSTTDANGNKVYKIVFNVFYCNWEESIERVEQRYISYLLWRYKKMRISPSRLRSSGNRAISDDILKIIEEDPQIKECLNYWHNHVTYITETNPTAIRKTVRTFLCEHGKEETEKYKVKYKDKNEFDQEIVVEEEKEKIVGYIEDNPNTLNLIFIDHISCCTTERGFTLKQSIDKIVDYCVGFRNIYKVSTVIIQQQNTQGESAQNIKINKIRPSKEGLADSTYTGNYCNILFGLFSPVKYDIENYMGYQIKGPTSFGDNIRFLECVLNRDGAGSAGELLPLFFDGAITWYHALPPSNTLDQNAKEELRKWYALAVKYRNEKKDKSLINPKEEQLDIDFIKGILE